MLGWHTRVFILENQNKLPPVEWDVCRESKAAFNVPFTYRVYSLCTRLPSLNHCKKHWLYSFNHWVVTLIVDRLRTYSGYVKPSELLWARESLQLYLMLLHLVTLTDYSSLTGVQWLLCSSNASRSDPFQKNSVVIVYAQNHDCKVVWKLVSLVFLCN